MRSEQRKRDWGTGTREWGVLLESKASYQNACIANNNPIPHSPTPIPYVTNCPLESGRLICRRVLKAARNGGRKTWN